MRVLIVFNPISGAGRAAQASRSLESFLNKEGIEVQCLETRFAPPDEWLIPRLEGADALIVVGGDGTVRLAAPGAMKTDTPIYQFPLGTENLFARDFGMDRSETRLLEALRHQALNRVDTGLANGLPFLLMVSVGYDAQVVHDLAAHRTGAISHSTYVLPILRQLVRWKPIPLTIAVDGERLIDSQSGFVVIANSHQYGRRLDPAKEAINDDGLLDVVFFPTRSRLRLVQWAWKCLRGTQMKMPSLITQRGQEIRVECETPQVFQVDGDVPQSEASDASMVPESSMTPLQISIRPASLPVLLPSKG